MLGTFLNAIKCACQVFKFVPLHIEESAWQYGNVLEMNSFLSPPSLFLVFARHQKAGTGKGNNTKLGDQA